MAFEPGNIVILKSGGLLMTVAETTGEGVQCVWLGEDGDLFRETLPESVLELAAVTGPEDEDNDDDEEDEEDADEDEEEEEDDETAARKVA